MFGIVRRSWVVLGDPIGPFARWRDLLCQLATEAASHGGWPVFFGVGEAAAKICSKLGFAVRRIGDQAIVPLDQFAIEKLSSELQESHRQIASVGCQFEVVARDSVPVLIPELEPVSEEWLRCKRTRGPEFLGTSFSVDYLERFPVGVVRSRGRILAFASLVGSAGRAELSIELVRYISNAPTGILDFVLVEAILRAKGQAYRTVNLGLAPPRGLGRRDTMSRWNRFGAHLYPHGEHYSDFNELRRAKARFAPRWDPRFVSSRPGLALARAIPDLAKLAAVPKQKLLEKPYRFDLLWLVWTSSQAQAQGRTATSSVIAFRTLKIAAGGVAAEVEVRQMVSAKDRDRCGFTGAG